MNRNAHGFTLIELLVVIGIIAVLTGILMPALAAARSHGKMISEMAGSRELGRAYVGYALDRKGKLLVGYTQKEAGTDEYGNPLSGQPAERYPWRLVAYIDHQIEGSILLNGQGDLIRQKIAGVAPGMKTFMWQYYVSFLPSLGLNYYNLGGDDENPNNNMPGWISKIDEAAHPSRMIVFASARTNDVQGFLPGWFYLHAPQSPIRPWAADYQPNLPAEQWGYVDPRWNGRAVFAHLDGHAELLNTEQMRDMTRWSNAAALAGDPDWSPTSP